MSDNKLNQVLEDDIIQSPGEMLRQERLAKELSIPKVIIPFNSSVFSAWGMLMSDMRRDYIQTKLLTINENAIDGLNHTFETMENTALRNLSNEKLDNEKISFNIKSITMITRST